MTTEPMIVKVRQAKQRTAPTFYEVRVSRTRVDSFLTKPHAMALARTVAANNLNGSGTKAKVIYEASPWVHSWRGAAALHVEESHGS